MVQLIVNALGKLKTIDVDGDDNITELHNNISICFGIPVDKYYLSTQGGKILPLAESISSHLVDGSSITMKLRIVGGIDFQHREGSKIGSGGQLSESQAAIERRERLRKLALETIDITKDPYIMRNHLGTFECKLCLTLHNNEGNYLAHTQGKRHQSNLARRAAMEARNAAPKPIATKEVTRNHTIKIGRPGYKVTKARDIQTRQRSLTFEIDYPQSEGNVQPRHRFMSSFEQKVEVPDKNFQYVLFACDPYETIAFKIPNVPVDKREGRFFTNWDAKNHKFILQLYFLEKDQVESLAAKSAPTAPPRPVLKYN